MYDILIVSQLIDILYEWLLSKDVVIKLKNFLPILEFTFKLNGGLKDTISVFLCFSNLFDTMVLSYFRLSL